MITTSTDNYIHVVVFSNGVLGGGVDSIQGIEFPKYFHMDNIIRMFWEHRFVFIDPSFKKQFSWSMQEERPSVAIAQRSVDNITQANTLKIVFSATTADADAAIVAPVYGKAECFCDVAFSNKSK
ncbi:hypothetical protein Tco_0348060 [Tanacetum coccineum]